MLVPKALGLKVLLIVLLINLLEDILESSVVLLENGVLGAHIQWQLLEKSHLETGVSESDDRLICVVLCLRNTGAGEVVDLDTFWLAAFGSEDDLECSFAGDDLVLGAVLVTKGVTADDNWLFPARDETGDVVDNNWLTEDGSIPTNVRRYFESGT